jgi:hypothetical protein
VSVVAVIRSAPAAAWKRVMWARISVDQPAAAELGDHAQVSDVPVVTAGAGRDGQARERSVGRVREPPPVPFAGCVEIELHVLACLDIRVLGGQFTSGADVETALGQAAEGVEEGGVVTGGEGQPGTGRWQARLRGPLVTQPLDLVGEAGAPGRTASPLDRGHRAGVGTPSPGEREVVDRIALGAPFPERTVAGLEERHGHRRAVGYVLVDVEAVQSHRKLPVRAAPPQGPPEQFAARALGRPCPFGPVLPCLPVLTEAVRVDPVERRFGQERGDAFGFCGGDGADEHKASGARGPRRRLHRTGATGRRWIPARGGRPAR